MRKIGVYLTAVALLACPFLASARCSISLKPETSGFFLSPTLDRVFVAKAVARDPNDPCPLKAGDEILQINDRVIPGAKAKDVMGYWKGLPKAAPQVFKVRRAGAVLSVVAK